MLLLRLTSPFSCLICTYPVHHNLPFSKNLNHKEHWVETFTETGHTQFYLLFQCHSAWSINHCLLYFSVFGLTLRGASPVSWWVNYLLTLLESANQIMMFWFGMLSCCFFFPSVNCGYEVWQAVFFSFRNQNWRFPLITEQSDYFYSRFVLFGWDFFLTVSCYHVIVALKFEGYFCNKTL